MKQKENHSLLQIKNINKTIKIKLTINKTVEGILKGFNPYEIHLEKSGIIYTINKGTIIYMYLA